MKRLFLISILLMLLTSFSPLFGFEVDGICYIITSNTDPYEVGVTRNFSNPYSNDVIIPETVCFNEKTYAVTNIRSEAFKNCTSLLSVVIPNSVTSIGDYAFFGCIILTFIDISSRLTSVGDYAFYGCGSLTSLVIPNSVTNIGNRAFNCCSGLTSIMVASGNPIYDSRNNSNAIIETRTNTLLYGCQTTLIPNTVTIIGDYAFCGCEGLISIEIPNSVTSIGHGAFSGCTSLTSIAIPNSVTVIEKSTFSRCTHLASVIIPNSVTSIEDAAFYECTGLSSIEIPNSVTSIAIQAFNGCSGLTSIMVASGNPIYDSRNNCNAIIETETNTLRVGCKNTIIPNSVTSIGPAAFQGCTGLTELSDNNIPNSVTTIGSHAFWGCTGLISIIIPKYVDSIGIRAFCDNPGLTSITVELGNSRYDSRNYCNAIIETETNSLITGCKNTVIPNSVTSIGDCAFCGSTDMTSVTIPKSVTSIAYGAFSGCTGLSSVIIKATIPPTVPTNNVVFEYITGQNALLYVPCGCKDAYANSEGYCWREWNTSLIIDTGFLYDFEVMSNDENYGSVHILQQPDCESNVATVKAEPIGEYLFVHWSANGQVVSLDNPYTFVVDDDVQLVAHFSGMGVDEKFAQSITIAPNPTQSIVNIECESMRNITLCTLDGRVTRTCEVNDDACTLDMTGMSKGIYVLRVETNDSAVINRKIIKE